MAYISRSNAEVLIPEENANEIFKAVPESSIVMQLGRRLPNMGAKVNNLPVMSALPVAYFAAEAVQQDGTDRKQTANAEWEKKVLTAAEIAVIVPIPEAVLDDAKYDIWGEIKPVAAEAIGKVFDAAVLYGTNKPSAWPAGIVTAAGTAGHTVALGTGADIFDDLMGDGGLFSLVEADGFDVTASVASLGMKGKLRGLRDENGQPIFKPNMQIANVWDLDGTPTYFPKNGAVDAAQSLLIAGQWDKLVWAFRQDLTYKVLDQAVIQDPSTGAIVYNLAQQDMVALRIVARLAWQLPNPINRVNTNATTRYPFAVLTPAVSGS